MIRGLCRDSLLLWCIIGDFNELAGEEDKRGGAAHPPWVYRGFKEVISDCSLQDIGLEGHPFMWARGLGTAASVEERLDKALVSKPWLVMFPQVRLRNLVSAMANHTPIKLSTCSRPVHCRRQPFQFENAWLRELELPRVISESWEQSLSHPFISLRKAWGMGKAEGSTLHEQLSPMQNPTS